MGNNGIYVRVNGEWKEVSTTEENTAHLIELAKEEAISESKEHTDNHIANTNNPHKVTKEQVGLGNVSNHPIATKGEAEAGTSNNTYMTPLRVLESLIVNAESVIDEIVVMKEHLPSDAGLEDFPKGISVGYTNKLGDNYPQRWGTLVNFKSRSDLVMAQLWFGNGGGTGTSRVKMYYRIYNSGRTDLENGWTKWYKVIDDLDKSDSTTSNSSETVATSKAIKYLNDALIGTDDSLRQTQRDLQATNANVTSAQKRADDAYARTHTLSSSTISTSTTIGANSKAVKDTMDIAKAAQKRADEAFTLGNKVKQDLADTLLSYNEDLPVEGANWSSLITFVNTELQNNVKFKVEFLEWLEKFIAGSSEMDFYYDILTITGIFPKIPATTQGKKEYDIYYITQIIGVLLKQHTQTAQGTITIKANSVPPRITLGFLPKTFNVSYHSDNSAAYLVAKILEDEGLVILMNFTVLDGADILGIWEIIKNQDGTYNLDPLMGSDLGQDFNNITWQAMSF